jgi:hypothetical protein
MLKWLTVDYGKLHQLSSYLAALFVTPAQPVVSKKFHHVAIYYGRYIFLQIAALTGNFHVQGAWLVSPFCPPEQVGVIFIATHLGEVGIVSLMMW